MAQNFVHVNITNPATVFKFKIVYETKRAPIVFQGKFENPPGSSRNSQLKINKIKKKHRALKVTGP